MTNVFQDRLKGLMHKYVKNVYKISKSFPKEEIYGTTSQLRRATLSIILNYIEGYARFTSGNKKQFYETSYGSLKETRYLIYFCHTEEMIPKNIYDELNILSDEIGKMLWSEINSLKK